MMIPTNAQHQVNGANGQLPTPTPVEANSFPSLLAVGTLALFAFAGVAACQRMNLFNRNPSQEVAPRRFTNLEHGTCPIARPFETPMGLADYMGECETQDLGFTGSFNATMGDLRATLGDTGSVADLTNEELQEMLSGTFPVSFFQTTSEIVGTPTGFMARFFHDPQLAEAERHALFKEMGNVCNMAGTDELLAKAIVNREMEVGTLVPIANPAGTTPLYYHVARRFITGEGMVAYALEPATRDAGKTLSKMILFRGSVFFPAGLDSISTYYTDVEKELGRTAFESGREMISEYLKSLPSGERIRLVGHSLGGVQAQWTAAEFSERIKQLVTFNAPGLPRDVADAFRQKSREIASEMVIDHFRTQGDTVDKAGDRLLSAAPANGKSTTTLNVFEPTPGVKYDAHKSRFLGRDPSEYTIHTYVGEELEYQLDNRAGRGRVTSFADVETLRQAMGKVATPILKAVKTASRTIAGSRVTSLHRQVSEADLV